MSEVDRYRCVDFFLNDKCSGLTGDCQEYLKGHYFSRFFTLDELKLSAPDQPIEVRKIIIKKAIDRLLEHRPIYKGDLRCRKTH